MDANVGLFVDEYVKQVRIYIDTKERIRNLAATIKSFGGTLPDIEEIHADGLNVSDVIAKAEEHSYPVTGTWKEKIFHTLKMNGKPLTAGEIFFQISAGEQNAGIEHIGDLSSVITSVASKMGVDGEIAVDNTQFRNKYSLLSQ